MVQGTQGCPVGTSRPRRPKEASERIEDPAQGDHRRHEGAPVRAMRATRATKRDHRDSKGCNQDSQEAPVGAQKKTKETKSTAWEPKES